MICTIWVGHHKYRDWKVMIWVNTYGFPENENWKGKERREYKIKIKSVPSQF
jgi:hypothetical protein